MVTLKGVPIRKSLLRRTRIDLTLLKMKQLKRCTFSCNLDAQYNACMFELFKTQFKSHEARLCIGCVTITWTTCKVYAD